MGFSISSSLHITICGFRSVVERTGYNMNVYSRTQATKAEPPRDLPGNRNDRSGLKTGSRGSVVTTGVRLRPTGTTVKSCCFQRDVGTVGSGEACGKGNVSTVSGQTAVQIWTADRWKWAPSVIRICKGF